MKKARTASGEALAMPRARSPAARRESPRGQLARSVWARARSAKDNCLSEVSTRAHSTSFLAVGSEMRLMIDCVPITSRARAEARPCWNRAMSWPLRTPFWLEA
ncbi:hypothetical protein D3C81_1485540 [compost metagenome]